MKPIVLAACPAVLSLLCLGCASRPVEPSLIERLEAVEEIKQAMHRSAEDWTANDLDGFMRAFHNASGTRFVVPSGITLGWDNIRARYANSIDKSSLWFTDISVTPITADTALCFARFHNEVFEDKSYSTGLTSLLMRKIDGRWVIVHDHSSGLPAGTPREDPGR